MARENQGRRCALISPGPSARGARGNVDRPADSECCANRPDGVGVGGEKVINLPRVGVEGRAVRETRGRG